MRENNQFNTAETLGMLVICIFVFLGAIEFMYKINPTNPYIDVPALIEGAKSITTTIHQTTCDFAVHDLIFSDTQLDADYKYILSCPIPN
ncbi:hypothetical protein [Fangia hongkongensis]|uniref:hypothetical protein n=1 Tax=Fangia hongkongensis TaxID=270495 RepID=UPI000381A533|nr:hypothetical protein [Fangia hongkongensis]MBK2124036.1 hypothetical protein [Fangia hongkongensis]